MMSRLSRGDFLKLAGFAATGTALAACAPQAPGAAGDGASPSADGGEVTIAVGAWALDSHKEVVDTLGFLDSGYTPSHSPQPKKPRL